MFTLKRLLFPPVGFHNYFWIKATLLKETPKAILIMFDNQKHWLPKAWIAKIKRTPSPLRTPKLQGEAIYIKISEYYWSKKF